MVRQLHRTKSEGMTDELKVVEVVGGRKPSILKVDITLRKNVRHYDYREEKLKAKYEF